jgi:hypothetical protein
MKNKFLAVSAFIPMAVMDDGAQTNRRGVQNSDD